MTEPERLILGWCLERGEVPACVAAIPVDALSGPAAVIRGLLVELQAVDVRWGPMDLYLWLVGDHAPTTEIGRSLLSWLALDEILLLPMAAPATLAEVAALCARITSEWAGREWYARLIAEIEREREEARIQEIDAACEHLPTLKPVGAIHAGWAAVGG